jgi:hypothetical protein
MDMKENDRQKQRGLGLTPIAAWIWFPFILMAILYLLDPLIMTVLGWFLD